jgi:Pilus formation protein N terminal region
MNSDFRKMSTRARTTRTASRLMRTVASTGFFALSMMPAAAGDLVVRYDQSQLLRLPRPASEIIIGNPSIADVALQDGNLLVVTGKTFGITNIIALDADHNVIQDQRVMVERDDRRVVNLLKGSQRFTYACTPNCEPTLTIGDEKTFFDDVKSANSSKTSFSDGASDKGNTSNNAQ